MSAPPPRKPRPPLPEGPFLVVGLARSGQAAARLLAARGEVVRGVDSGHPDGAAGLAGAGVEVFLDTDGLALLEGTRTVVKSPGVPREAPVIAAALERGIEVVGELELAWRAIPNRFVAVTGTNGKTTTVELLGHLYRTAGEPVAVAGNVGTPLSSLAGEVEPSATVVCECSSFQLEDSDRLRPRVRGLPQPRARPPRPPPRPRVLPGGEAADLRQPGQRRRRRLQRRRAGAGRGRPRRLRAPRRLLPRRRPRLRGRAGRGDDLPRRRAAAARSRSSACSASTTSPTRWPPPPRRSRWASTATRCARACAASPASPHRLEPVRRDRRRPLRQRLQGDQRRLGDRRPARLRGRRPRDPRRQREGRALRAAASTRCASAAPPAT